MSRAIDLNADLGELPGAEGRASDRAILAEVTSCAIACGGHAGDAATMEATLLAAQAHNVLAGAHPSYPDRENFGRRSMAISPEDLHAALCSQMMQLSAIADRLGVALAHIKPHGALYNDAAKIEATADTVARAAQSCFGTKLALVGPPNSETEKAAKRHGLRFFAEGFMDRTYMPDGSLMPRGQDGAVLEDTDARLHQACLIARDQQVTDCNGTLLALPAKTICLHGDSPGAAQTARLIRAALGVQGISVTPMGHG